MNRTLIVGDLHLRKEQPFLSAAQKVLGTILDITSTDDHVIFLGDFFHSSRPYPEELRIASSFFSDFKGKITILAGNHEFLQTRDSFAEYAFGDAIEFIEEPTETEEFLYLPWISSSRVYQKGYDTLKEFYEGYLANFVSEYPESSKPLYVLYHFEDETTFMGLDELGIDLSFLEKRIPNRKIVRVGGHIHVPSENYLGTPYVTRRDESGKGSFILVRDGEEDFRSIEIPTLISYEDVDYDDLNHLKFNPNISYILSVENVPHADVLFDWKKSHPNVWIDDYTLKFGEDRVILDETKDQAESIKEYLELFIKQNKVDKDTANYLLSVF